ncbi:TetR/AcrR family transcriptional regulator [Streptomyces antimycoticus]|uniref:TetR/AcrR family transcriptional regulator n=1 Tax=Streptomyces antimycoticus TaxID=68175 RepID=UPI000A376309|nr:TetR/AcrR family transcriptional regulator [Streptomyces antimycoticus]
MASTKPNDARRTGTDPAIAADPFNTSDSEAERRTLIDSAGRIIAEQGLSNARVRDIADAARISPVSVLFHYPDNDQLLLDVHKRAVDAYFTGRKAAAEGHSDPRRQLVAMVLAGIPPHADQHTIELLYELHSLSRRSAAHADLMSELWRLELDLYQQVVDAGVEQRLFEPRLDVADLAAALLALEDGLVLHLVSDSASLDAMRVVELFTAAAGSELGCPTLADFAREAVSSTIRCNW